jgi:predicted hotdog family 3-hydroxylacyl-ACP dehydratase
MKIHLWRGGHSGELLTILTQAIERRELLVVCPPLLKDFSFLSALPRGEVVWHGLGGPPEDLPESGSLSRWSESFQTGQPQLGVFTSGTASAKPRLILYTRENIEASVGSVWQLFDTSRIDTIFCYPQPFHTFGLTLGYYLAAARGVKLVTPTDRYSRAAHAVRSAVESEKVLTLGTPLHFSDLISYLKDQGQTLHPSYTAIVGGAPVSRQLWLALRSDLQIEAPSIGYGASEASPGLTHLPPGFEPATDGEIGMPLAGVDIKLSEGSGLTFRGPNSCLATFDGAELDFSNERFLADDIEVIEGGRWRFRGRFDLVINRGGQKIALDMVEQRLKAEVGLDLVASQLEDQRLGQDMGVLVLFEKDHSEFVAVRNRILNFLSTEFGLSISPSHIVAAPTIPVSANLKYDRRQISDWIKIRREFPLRLDMPIRAEDLDSLAPHRGEMVWIDEVLEVTPKGGRARVALKAERLFMSDGKLRSSSLIEFVAQTFSLFRAIQSLKGFCEPLARPKRAFLVGTRSSVIHGAPEQLPAGTVLEISVGNCYYVSPFIVFDGEVRTSAGELVFTTNMKVFCD